MRVPEESRPLIVPVVGHTLSVIISRGYVRTPRETKRSFLKMNNKLELLSMLSLWLKSLTQVEINTYWI